MSAEELLHACAELARRGWVANHDGNISIRLPGGRFLVTPTAFRKADIGATDLLIVDLEGRVLSGRHRVFSEWQLHQAVYSARPKVGAVIHCHSPAASAFAVAHRQLPIDFMPEALVSLGAELAHIPALVPGDEALGQAVEKAARECNSALIYGHGPLSWGDDLTMALARMELVEHLAEIAWRADRLGGAQPVAAELKQKLLSKHKKAGLAAPEAAP